MHAFSRPTQAPHAFPTLPATPAPRPGAGRPLRVVLYGVEGVGKSTFASEAPSPVFLTAEDGVSQLDVARFPTPSAWADVLEAIRVLTYEEHAFKTLVIDTLDWLEPLCWQYVCDSTGAASLDDIPYGKGYIAAAEQWRRLLARLELLVRTRRMNVVLLGQATIRKVDGPTGSFDRFMLRLHERAQEPLREWADAVLFARHEAVRLQSVGQPRRGPVGARVLHTTWAPAYDARNWFALPETLPLSWDEFDTAARAYRPTDVNELRRAILDLIPRVSEPAKAERAMYEWAGEDLGRLAQLLDRVRSRMALEGGGEALDPAPTR